MVEIRRGLPSDASELVRLRSLMLGAMHGVAPRPGVWEDNARAAFRAGLADPAGASMAAFVVTRPDDPATLAACAVGLVERRLSSPANPGGEFGYVLNVATDEGFRRRGYARACMEALMDWFAQRDISTIDLRATDDGGALYTSLGFRPASRTMRFVRD